MDQHANTFSETLSQSVQKDIEPGIGPGIVPGNNIGQETKTVIGVEAHDCAGRIAPNVKIKFAPKSAPHAVIGGKALQDWIKEKGALMERQQVVKELLSDEEKDLWKEPTQL
jgi:hypothetical protein